MGQFKAVQIDISGEKNTKYKHTKLERTWHQTHIYIVMFKIQISHKLQN